MSAVIFDLFDTLVTPWGKPYYTKREMASDLHVNPEEFSREWELLHHDRYLGKLRGMEAVLNAILEKLDIKRDENLIERVSRRRDECIAPCFHAIEPKILNMLSSLKEKGFKLGLISNCSSEEIEELRDCALYPYFDAVVLSCDVEMVKPDLNIYQHCLSLLHEKADDCWYAGDGGSNELYGALRAGMKPVKAVWFIKGFVQDYDSDKTYPICYESDELLRIII